MRANSASAHSRALGWGVAPALAAAERLASQHGLHAAVANARFVSPLDRSLLLHLASHTRRLITVEDHNAAGGFGSAVLEALADHGPADVQVTRLALPDTFHPHGPPDALRAAHGLSVDGLVSAARDLAAATLDVRLDAGRLTLKA